MHQFFRVQPFSLIIVVDLNGNAEGDLFYDDGESIDTINSKAYFYATFKWSLSDTKLTMNVAENGYREMSSLKLNSMTIYGLNDTPTSVYAGERHFVPSQRPNTQIVEVNNMDLPMDPSQWIMNAGVTSFVARCLFHFCFIICWMQFLLNEN